MNDDFSQSEITGEQPVTQAVLPDARGHLDETRTLPDPVSPGSRGGQEYLDVRHRLLRFRNDHPDGSVSTDHVRLDDDLAVFKATVEIPGGGSATGHGSETSRDSEHYIEDAETRALGRALHALGYEAKSTGTDDVVGSAGKRKIAPHPSAPPTGRGDAHRGDREEYRDGEDAADYSWSAFWNWARSAGYRSKEEVESAIGTSISGMRPVEVRERLGRRPSREI